MFLIKKEITLRRLEKAVELFADALLVVASIVGIGAMLIYL